MGLCGISCDDCGLYQQKICNGCISKEEWKQKEKNTCCDIANCAHPKNVKHCSLECDKFPCNVYRIGYPYSDKYLKMYESRKNLRKKEDKE